MGKYNDRIAMQSGKSVARRRYLFWSTGLWLGILVLVLSALGCAMTPEERDAAIRAIDSHERLNMNRVFTPVKITGVQQITGNNIIIETQAPLDPIDQPVVQYNDEKNRTVTKAANTLGLAAGIVGTLWAGSEYQQESIIVTQPEPIIVRPEIVTPLVLP